MEMSGNYVRCFTHTPFLTLFKVNETAYNNNDYISLFITVIETCGRSFTVWFGVSSGFNMQYTNGGKIVDGIIIFLVCGSNQVII